MEYVSKPTPRTSLAAPLEYIVSALALLFIGISFGASAVRYYEVDLKKDIHGLTTMAWIFGVLLLTLQQILLRRKRRKLAVGFGEKY